MDFLTLQQSNLKIPRALISSPDVFLTQKSLERCHLKEMNPTKVILMKYYPKYYRSLFIDKDFRKGSVLSKVRQVKTIQNFRYNFLSWGDLETERVYKLIRNTLQTKRKSITSPNVIYHSSEGNPYCLVPEMEICRLFPKIKSLSVYTFTYLLEQEGHADHSSQSLQKHVLGLHQSFWGALRSLKNFELFICSNGLWRLFLNKLESAQRFLSSLETFYLRLWFDRKEKDPGATFQFLLGYKDILKHVTYIDLTYHLDYCYYGEQVMKIVNSCPKLREISFIIKEESIEEESSLQNPRDGFNMPSFKSLQNVKVLQLCVQKVWYLIEYFEFPPCLEILDINFNFPDWHLVWAALYPEIQDNDDPAVLQSFEKYRILLNFFEKFKQLTHLRSLKITITQFIHSDNIINNFLLPLLRSIPQLETFECQFKSGCWDSKTSPLDLAVLLNVITPLKQLKSLKLFRYHDIDDVPQEKDLIIKFDPQKDFVFPNISFLDIGGWISPDFDFKQFLKTIPSSQNQIQINLSKINLNSIDSFAKLLTDFKMVNQSNSLKINLNILLHIDDLNEIPKAFKYPIVLANNLTITLKIYFPSAIYFTLLPKGIVLLQNIFSSFKFDITMKLSSQSHYRQNEIEIRYIPLIINNLEQPRKDPSFILPSEYKKIENA